MRMKRWKMAAIVLLALPFTGCMKQYDIPEAKSDAIAEYMAGTLLQSDSTYKENLIPEEELGLTTPDDNIIDGGEGDNITVTPTTTPIPSVTDGVDKNHGTDGKPDDTPGKTEQNTLSEVIGHEGFNVNYYSKKITDRYPENPSNLEFSYNARQGDQILALTFRVENLMKKEEVFNLVKQNISYQLTDDEGNVYQPLFTLLINDMQYIDITVPSGKSKAGILIFEIPKNKMLTKSKLTVSNGDKTVTIELK